MTKAFLHLCETVYQPCFVLAVLAIVAAAVRLVRKKEVPKFVIFCSGAFLFSLAWRVFFKIVSHRYSFAMILPGVILSGWALQEWIRCGLGGEKWGKKRLVLTFILLGSLSIGVIGKEFRNERPYCRILQDAGNQTAELLKTYRRPALLAHVSDASRIWYYAVRNNRVKVFPSYPFYRGQAVEDQRRFLAEHDGLVAILPENVSPEDFKAKILKVAYTEPVLHIYPPMTLKKHRLQLIHIDNRKSASFGYASKEDAEPLPKGAVLLQSEDFDDALPLTENQNAVSGSYLKLGYEFARNPQNLFPRHLSITDWGGMERGDRTSTRFLVQKDPSGNQELFFQSQPPIGLRMEFMRHQYKSYVYEFEVRPAAGTSIKLGMLQYGKYRYFGIALEQAEFYALSDAPRFCRFRVRVPEEKTTSIQPSFYLQGKCAIDNVKIYGVREE